MDLGLTGMKAIVTGGSRGIGRAIATALRAEGVSVAICARGEASLGEAHAALEATGSGGVVFSRATDLEVADEVRAFARDAIAALGGLDIFVHNASGFTGTGEEGWLRSFNVDIMAANRILDVALPALEASGRGSVVFIGSTASVQWFPRPGTGATSYGPAKAAMRTLANELGQSLGRQRIRANVVSPGSTLFDGGGWDRVRQEQPALWDGLVKQFPFRRLVTAEEVARAVIFVASPAGSGVNATHLIVDGGQHKGVS
jgi:NAD(P)-dependent dehydrogenase (short-subunit alcohol dehydrogenase family)